MRVGEINGLNISNIKFIRNYVQVKSLHHISKERFKKFPVAINLYKLF